MPDQKPRKAGRRGFRARLALQCLGQLRHRDVRLVLDAPKQGLSGIPCVRGQIAHAAAAPPRGRRAAALPTVHQFDRATGAHPKIRRRPAPGTATLNKPDDPLTQIQRERRADDPPPTMVKHALSPRGKPLSRFLITVRRSNEPSAEGGGGYLGGGQHARVG
jgi:hypothetical protein